MSSNVKSFEAELSAASANLPLIRLSGDLDQFSEDLLLAKLREAADRRNRVIALDFREVSSISGGGLVPLFVLAAKARSRHLLVYAVNLSDHFKSVFRLARLDIGIPIAGSLSEVRLSAFRHRFSAGEQHGQ